MDSMSCREQAVLCDSTYKLPRAVGSQRQRAQWWFPGTGGLELSSHECEVPGLRGEEFWGLAAQQPECS